MQKIKISENRAYFERPNGKYEQCYCPYSGIQNLHCGPWCPHFKITPGKYTEIVKLCQNSMYELIEKKS